MQVNYCWGEREEHLDGMRRKREVKMKNILVEEIQRLRKTLLHGHKRLTFSKLINWPQKNNVLKDKGKYQGLRRKKY